MRGVLARGIPATIFCATVIRGAGMMDVSPVEGGWSSRWAGSLPSSPTRRRPGRRPAARLLPRPRHLADRLSGPAARRQWLRPSSLPGRGIRHDREATRWKRSQPWFQFIPFHSGTSHITPHRAAAVNSPATRSSISTPQPLGSRSACWAGKGFTMSKTRKSRKTHSQLISQRKVAVPRKSQRPSDNRREQISGDFVDHDALRVLPGKEPFAPIP